MQPPKKQPERSVEAHIYMTPKMKKRLEKLATKAMRSMNGQILYYLDRGLGQDEEAQ